MFDSRGESEVSLNFECCKRQEKQIIARIIQTLLS